MAVQKYPIVGVMGSHSEYDFDKVKQLSALLARFSVHLLTGGGGGAMGAMSQHFSECSDRVGKIIGIIPDLNEVPADFVNQWVEIPIFTGLTRAVGAEYSRNHVNILTADIVIALKGSAGTLEETSLSVRYSKPCIAYVSSRDDLRGLPEEIKDTDDIVVIEKFLQNHLPKKTAKLS